MMSFIDEAKENLEKTTLEEKHTRENKAGRGGGHFCVGNGKRTHPISSGGGWKRKRPVLEPRIINPIKQWHMIVDNLFLLPLTW